QRGRLPIDHGEGPVRVAGADDDILAEELAVDDTVGQRTEPVDEAAVALERPADDRAVRSLQGGELALDPLRAVEVLGAAVGREKVGPLGRRRAGRVVNPGRPAGGGDPAAEVRVPGQPRTADGLQKEPTGTARRVPAPRVQFRGAEAPPGK